MPINLKEHAIFIDRLQMDMVPLSVASAAVLEALSAKNDLQKAFTDIQNSIDSIKDND